MSGPLRRPTIPQCSACLRSYAFGAHDAAAPVSAVRLQVRGKKKMANNSATVTVRLLKDMPTFGRRGEPSASLYPSQRSSRSMQATSSPSPAARCATGGSPRESPPTSPSPNSAPCAPPILSSSVTLPSVQHLPRGQTMQAQQGQPWRLGRKTSPPMSKA